MSSNESKNEVMRSRALIAFTAVLLGGVIPACGDDASPSGATDDTGGPMTSTSSGTEGASGASASSSSSDGSTSNAPTTSTDTTAADTGIDTEATSEGTETSDTETTGEAASCHGGQGNAECSAPGGYTGSGECDPYAQDCADGERCYPLVDGGSWTTVCQPVVENPRGLLETCTVTGSNETRTDDCDVGLRCNGTSPQGEEIIWRCEELCGCGEASPTCSGGDPDQVCFTPVGGPELAICTPTCNPVDPECNGINDWCGFNSDVNTYHCAPSTLPPGSDGLTGDACGYAMGCMPGHVCALSPAALATCDGGPGCCVQFCDLDSPDCPAEAPNCQPAPFAAPTECLLESVGICV